MGVGATYTYSQNDPDLVWGGGRCHLGQSRAQVMGKAGV